MRLYTFTLLFAFVHAYFYAQENSDDMVLEAYEDYVELPREIVFLHTNKTTYIKGEQLGFQAYCLEKESKRLSKDTKNLYVTISNKDGLPIKQQLVKVDKGLASGVFEIDSLFASGTYTLLAFTNWMKNFQEPNYFKQTIEILDFKEGFQENLTTNVRPDVQVLPEGGHLVMGVESVIGIAIKDASGLGIPNVEGELVDETGNSLGKISCNKHGHGRFKLKPDIGRTYAVKINFEGKELEYPLPKSENKGVVLTLLDQGGGLSLTLSTNQASNNEILRNTYSLLVHNGEDNHLIALNPFTSLKSNNDIPRGILFPGMNIFTVFDSSGQPLVERLYFNYEGISLQNKNLVEKTNMKDSIEVSISSAEPILNASVSILPSASVTYRPHHNLASYTLLQPYVKGYIENAEYYFKDTNELKKEELDLLLLTQGWSSYSWENIFNSPPDYDYDFEEGIRAVIQRDAKKGNQQYVVIPYGNNNLEIVSFEEGQEKLEKTGLFPDGDDFFRIGRISSKGKLSPADVTVSFYPSKVPEIDTSSQALGYGSTSISKTDYSERFRILNQIRALEEVIVQAKRKSSQLESLQNKTFGNVEEITNEQKQHLVTFRNYISRKGFLVREEQGRFLIVNQQAQNFGSSGEPSIYIDDHLLNPFITRDTTIIGSAGLQPDVLSVLSNLRLSEIDYIEVNKKGLGEGINSGGVIRIYTGEEYKSSRKRSNAYTEYSEHPFEMTFTQEREFYVPRYSSYESDFFEYFGVLDWLPQLKSDVNGLIKFKVSNAYSAGVKIFVEGITNQGSFVSQTISLSPNE
ncbi:hypothetical protein [Flagellimonas meridianipacifica]|uniref:TonB-dependent receptor-like protein n=1 Tax=Flagellimonas meridianipacifica TaxID=1080225 RepID=A0A2T0MH20_9FLAO|nr:hypothetical protein [Allomuricauda pacifica]PRX56862.1 hypothetical protein CLV81_0860 [Allomuricauda pacifica]